MAIFQYKSIDVSGKVVNEKGVELFILSKLVYDILNEYGNWISDTNNENKLYRYSDAFIFKIDGMQHFGLDDEAVSIVNRITTELKRKGLVAIDKVADYGSRLVLMSNFDEMAVYFKEVLLQCLDSFEVIDDFHGGDSDISGDVDHYTKIRILHGSDEWEYTVGDGIDSHISKKVVINSAEVSSLQGDAQWVDMLLTTLAIMTRKDMVDERVINKSNNIELYVKQAKAVASILGGDYKRYLIIVTVINDHEGLIAGLSISKDLAIKLLLTESLRASEAQIKEVAKIFSDKPLYH